MRINRLFAFILIMGCSLLFCQSMSLAMIERKLKKGEGSSIPNIVYGRGEKSLKEVASNQEAYDFAKTRALAQLSQSISVSVQNMEEARIQEEEKNGTYTTSDLYKSATTLSSGTLIKKFKTVTTGSSGLNDTIVYCWKYIADVEKETKAYNRGIGRIINEFIDYFDNDKERKVKQKLNYIFSAHSENKKQVKGYEDTFEVDLKKIEMKLGEFQEDLGLTLELKNKPETLSVGEKYHRKIELKFIKESNHHDLKGLGIKLKLVSGLLDGWNKNGIEIEKINSLDKIILPIGKVLSNEKIRIELDYDFSGMGIDDPAAIKSLRKILSIENSIIDIEVNPEILISFDKVKFYKFSNIKQAYIGEINDKLEELENTESFKWISKGSDRQSGYKVSIKNLNYSKSEKELSGTFIVKDTNGEIVSSSKESIVLLSNQSGYKIRSRTLEDINAHIATLIDNVTTGQLSININSSENLDIDHKIGFNIYKFYGKRSLARKVNKKQIKFSISAQNESYVEELNFGYYILESRKDLDNKYYRHIQDTILISNSKQITKKRYNLVRSQSILDIGNIKIKNEIDIIISKTSGDLFSSNSNHISIVGGIIDESRTDIDNIINRIEGSRIILSPDVYTLKVKTRGIPTIKSPPINLIAEDSRGLFKVQNLLSESSKPMFKILPFTKPFVYNESFLSKVIKTTLLASSFSILYDSVIDVSENLYLYEERKGEYLTLVDVEQQVYVDKYSQLQGSIDSYSKAQTSFYYSFAASVLVYGLTITLSF